MMKIKEQLIKKKKLIVVMLVIIVFSALAMAFCNNYLSKIMKIYAEHKNDWGEVEESGKDFMFIGLYAIIALSVIMAYELYFIFEFIIIIMCSIILVVNLIKHTNLKKQCLVENDVDLSCQEIDKDKVKVMIKRRKIAMIVISIIVSIMLITTMSLCVYPFLNGFENQVISMCEDSGDILSIVYRYFHYSMWLYLATTIMSAILVVIILSYVFYKRKMKNAY